MASRQERRNELAQQRGFASYYAERVAKGAQRGLDARQAVGKAPRSSTAAQAPTGATTAAQAPQMTTVRTAAGVTYKVRVDDVGRLSTLIGNVQPGRRLSFVLTDENGMDHAIYGRGGRRAGAVRADIAAAGGIREFIADTADSIASTAGGSDWVAEWDGGGIEWVTMTVSAA